MVIEITAFERQTRLLEEMRRRGHLTHNQAWTFGHEQGFYAGGHGDVTLFDLNALAQRNQARRHDGFWRHCDEPDRERYKIWSDYWTPQERG